MRWCVLRPLAAVLVGWSSVWAASHAQTLLSLREATEAAWALSPQARALASREAELAARERAASSLMAGAPSVSLSHRTDRVGSNSGLRESELELSAPVAMPDVRRAAVGQVQADRVAFEQQQLLARLKVSSEVSELAGQAAAAQAEVEVARNKQREAQLLSADVERRVKAGEVARVDLLQAESVQRQAATAQAQAESALTRAVAQWRALTGLTQLASLEIQVGQPQEHPAVTATQAQLSAARAKLAWTSADRRDPMEVGVGVVRERSAFGSPYESSVKLTLRVPLGSYGRNAPKLAAAQAEVDTAEAEAQAAARQVEAERAAARAELEAARRAEMLATERERASREMQALIAKSYRLGESDLPTRLRAESERFDAELALARARLETSRAILKLNQAYGILP